MFLFECLKQFYSAVNEIVTQMTTEVFWLHSLAAVETASSHYRLQFIVMTLSFQLSNCRRRTAVRNSPFCNSPGCRRSLRLYSKLPPVGALCAYMHRVVCIGFIALLEDLPESVPG